MSFVGVRMLVTTFALIDRGARHSSGPLERLLQQMRQRGAALIEAPAIAQLAIDIIDLGVVDTKECTVCERQRPFHLQVHYVYQHFNYIIRMVSSKEYWKVCEICGRGWVLPAAATEQTLGRNPIPAFDRIGAWIFGGLILFLVGTLTLAALL